MRAIAVALLFSVAAEAHDVITTKLTWSREVSRIFYRRCINCHSNGREAFSLTTYEAARPWAQAIKEEVLSRRMPPWSAIKGFGELRDDVALTQEEIEVISDWVEGGAPKGNDRLLPELPQNLPKPKRDSTPVGGSLRVEGSLALKRRTVLTGIRPLQWQEGASVKVIAELPGGEQIPLIWLYNSNPRVSRTYYLKNAQLLPKGTEIILSPPSGNAVLLVTTSGRKQGL